MINNIILSDAVLQRPKLKKSDKYSAKELSQMLLSTAYKGYNNSIEPLFILGLAVMAPFRNLFLKNIKGFPVAYLYGTTSAGKTNILNSVAFMHGYDEEYIYSGDSTVLSMWQNLDSCSCIPVIYDEISRRALNDNYFEGLIKSAFQGTNRDKIAKIKTTIKATLIMSSNFQPPQKPEILNRLLLCNFEQQKFKVDEVRGFNDIREKYLSNILPAILKQKSNAVMEIFNAQNENIKNIDSKLKGRCINNIAIAYTGYQILLNIAEEKQPNEIAISFKNFVKNYDNALKVETPWEEFIKSLPILARNKTIAFGKDYRYAVRVQEKIDGNNITQDVTPIHLCIHFEQAYKAFSMYYRQLKRDFPPTQKELLLYAKNDAKVIAGKAQITKSINIGGIKKRCLVIDIQENYELSVLDKMESSAVTLQSQIVKAKT